MTPTQETGSAGHLAELRDALHALEARVTALEADRRPVRAAPTDPGPSPADVAEVASLPESPSTIGFGQGFGLVGRATLFLAGAFLLRALTENRILPPLGGFGLGLGYAVCLVGLAAHFGKRGEGPVAVATGLAGILVAFPFVYETTAVSTIVSPAVGAGVLALLTTAGLAVAAGQRLRILYWAYGLAALATITALHFATGAAVIFSSLLLALGAATTVLAYARGWYLMRWPVAAVADLVILHLAVTSTNPGGTMIAGRAVPGEAVLILAVALVVVYLGIFAYRALIQGRGVRTFDVVQSGLVIAVGYGTGSSLAEHLDKGQGLLGWAALVTALAGYGVAFTVVRRRHGRGRAFFYFATLALLFLVLGSRHVVPHGLQAWAWTALGVITAWLGGRLRRSTLRAHSAVYLMLAFAATGIFPAARDAFLGDPSTAWSAVGPAGIAALLASAGCYVILLRSRNPEAPRSRRIPRLLVGIMTLTGVGWLVILLLTRTLAGVPAGAATVSVIRTAVLAGTSVLLAWAGRSQAYAELTWLVYPLLIAGLVKVLLEDLKVGNPIALTVSFALFGGALILAPRLLKKRGSPAPAQGD